MKRVISKAGTIKIIILVSSCGSAPNGPTGNQGTPGGDVKDPPTLTSGNPKSGPLSLAECGNYWAALQKAKPKNLKLSYVTEAMGTKEFETYEVLESNESIIKERLENKRELTEKKITKAQILEDCSKRGIEGDIPSNATDVLQRIEKKSVRAGTFNGMYIRYKISQFQGGAPSNSIVETWNLSNGPAPITLYSSIDTIVGNVSIRYTKELISMYLPK